MLDSSNVIDSPTIKSACVNLIISKVVALVWPAKIAIAPLDAPLILSPKIVLLLSDNPLTNISLSKIGSVKFTDS